MWSRDCEQKADVPACWWGDWVCAWECYVRCRCVWVRVQWKMQADEICLHHVYIAARLYTENKAAEFCDECMFRRRQCGSQVHIVDGVYT